MRLNAIGRTFDAERHARFGDGRYRTPAPRSRVTRAPRL